MPNPNWMDRISAMTANSKRSYINSRAGLWKISIADINYSDCTWVALRRAVFRYPLNDFIVWFRISKDLPWEKVADTHINSHCSCGRAWIDLNGNLFAFRGESSERQNSYESMIKWINMPLRCKFCFYRDEHAKGNWAPKDVIKALGLNPN
jgi:hypothetical protein